MTSWIVPVEDAWCEYLDLQLVDGNPILFHPDGHWTVWFYGAGYNLKTNMKDYKVGALSIEVECIPSPYIDNQFELRNILDSELNLNNAKLLNFWIKPSRLGGPGGISQHFTVILVDAEWRKAERTLSFSIADWHHYSENLGDKFFQDWIVESGFDLTRVKEVWFKWTQYECYPLQEITASILLDGLQFYFALDISVISVDSNPISAVPVRLDSAVQGKTPFIATLEPAGIYEVTVDNEHNGWLFDHWNDGVLTPGRTVDATQPRVYSFTAFYREAKQWHLGYYLQELMNRIRERVQQFTLS